MVVPNPDLEIKEGGEGGHLDPQIRGEGRTVQNFFWPFGLQFGLKNKGGGTPRVPPLDPPLSGKILFTCVAIPAWSHPGFHNAVFPICRFLKVLRVFLVKKLLGFFKLH